jgi:hypothetical protein
MNKPSDGGDNKLDIQSKPSAGTVDRSSVEMISKIASLVGMTSEFPMDEVNPSDASPTVEVVPPVMIPPIPDLPLFDDQSSQSDYKADTPEPRQKPAPKNSIIPMQMENGKPKHSSPYVHKSGAINVSDFVSEVLPANEMNEMLGMAMNLELNKLHHRLPHLLLARDLLLSQVRHNGAKRMLDMYTRNYRSEPRKTDLHPFTAMAIARFLKEALPREELYFGVMVTIPPKFNLDFESKDFQFVTILGFNRTNKAGGKSLMENPKKMLFIDVSSPNPHFEDKLIVDKVSEMQNYGFRPYNNQKEHHHRNVFARRAYENVFNWASKDLDNYSQFLLDALTAPDKISQFEYNPNLFAEALMKSISGHNKITRGVRQELLRALGVKKLDSDSLDEVNGGFKKEK